MEYYCYISLFDMGLMSVIKANQNIVKELIPIKPKIEDIEEGLDVVIYDGLKVMRDIITNDTYNEKTVDVKDKIGAMNATISLGRYLEIRKTNKQKQSSELEVDDNDLIIGG